MSNFVAVTAKQFFAAINRMDVHPKPQGTYPYMNHWEMPNRTLIGRSQDTLQYDRNTGTSLCNYWLRSDLVPRGTA